MARAKGIASQEWDATRAQVGRMAALGMAVVIAGCGHFVPEGARRASMKGPERINQAELEQDVERFAAVFMDRVTDAAMAVAPEVTAHIRLELLRRTLRYDSAALEIATGRDPEVNLLDMVAFVTLSRQVLEQHWIPEMFGEAGQPLATAFADSARDLDAITSKLLSREQKAELRDVIRAWRDENPALVEVEGVRLFSFSQIAGEAAASRAEKTRGLLSTVRAATSAADQALLLGERAMFLSQRLPFLIRLQVRLGAGEIVGDTVTSLSQLEDLADRIPELRPLLRELTALVENAGGASREAHALMQSLHELVAARERAGEPGLEEILTSANQLTDKSLTLLSELNSTIGGDDAAAATMTHRVDRLVRRWMAIGAGLALVVIALFWIGYVIARRFTAG